MTRGLASHPSPTHLLACNHYVSDAEQHLKAGGTCCSLPLQCRQAYPDQPASRWWPHLGGNAVPARLPAVVAATAAAAAAAGAAATAAPGFLTARVGEAAAEVAIEAAPAADGAATGKRRGSNGGGDLIVGAGIGGSGMPSRKTSCQGRPQQQQQEAEEEQAKTFDLLLEAAAALFQEEQRQGRRLQAARDPSRRAGRNQHAGQSWQRQRR